MIYLKQWPWKGENCKYVLDRILLLSFVIIFALSACARTNQSTDAPIHIQNEISPSPSPSPSPSHPPSPSSSPLDDESQEMGVVGTTYSSDGRYFIEGYCEDSSLPMDVGNPIIGMRIVEVNSKKTVWNMDFQLRKVEFIWSPNCRYVSIFYAVRPWGHALIVDTLTMTEEELPGIVELEPMFPDAPPKNILFYPKSIPQYWLDDCRIRVAFSWLSDITYSGDDINGFYTYNVDTGEFVIEEDNMDELKIDLAAD